MRVDTEYANACNPPRWRILGRMCGPYSLGHRIILDAFGSPFTAGGEPDLSDLLTAVTVVSKPYAVARKMLWEPLSLMERYWTSRVSRWLLRRPAEAAQRMAMFNEFLDESCKMPRVRPDTSRTRETNCPSVLNLKISLMSIGYSEAEALDCPFGQAMWEHWAVLEKDNAATFASDADIESQETLAQFAREQDAKLNLQ